MLGNGVANAPQSMLRQPKDSQHWQGGMYHFINATSEVKRNVWKRRDGGMKVWKGICGWRRADQAQGARLMEEAYAISYHLS